MTHTELAAAAQATYSRSPRRSNTMACGEPGTSISPRVAPSGRSSTSTLPAVAQATNSRLPSGPTARAVGDKSSGGLASESRGATVAPRGQAGQEQRQEQEGRRATPARAFTQRFELQPTAAAVRFHKPSGEGAVIGRPSSAALDGSRGGSDSSGSALRLHGSSQGAAPGRAASELKPTVKLYTSANASGRIRLTTWPLRFPEAQYTR